MWEACWFALGLITQRYGGSIPSPATKRKKMKVVRSKKIDKLNEKDLRKLIKYLSIGKLITPFGKFKKLN